MLFSVSTALLWRGLLALAIGIVSVVWPNITVGAFVILFAVFAFVAAGSDAARAFSSDRAGPVAGYLLLALLSLAAGVIALLWPGLTALVLTLVIAVWALVTGIIEVALAFRQGETAGERAMWALGGLVSLALGVVLALRIRRRPAAPGAPASALDAVSGSRNRGSAVEMRDRCAVLSVAALLRRVLHSGKACAAAAGAADPADGVAVPV